LQGLFPLSLRQMLSSYKSKYDDIDWIVDTRNLPATSDCPAIFSISTRNALDDELSCFTLNLLMPRIHGLAFSYAVDRPVPNLLGFP
jgi:hypothetical protein